MLLVTLAVAAPLLVLPPGEDPRPWSAPALLAGVDLVQGAPRIEIRDIGTTWEIRVGDGKAVQVPEPVDAAGRERVAALARSLTRDGIAAPPPALVPMPTPTPSPVATPVAATTPRPKSTHPSAGPPRQAPALIDAAPTDEPKSPSVVAAPPQVAVGPSPPDVAPPSVSPSVALADESPHPAEVGTPPATPPFVAAPAPTGLVAAGGPSAPTRTPARLVLRAGGEVRARPGTTVAGGAGLGAGFQFGALDVEIGGAWCAPRDLDVVEDAASVHTFTLFGGAGWSGRGLVSPFAAVAAGADARAYRSGQESLVTLWTPFASLQVGGRLRLSETLAVEGGVRGQLDLGKTLIQIGDADPVPLVPWELAGTLGLRFAAR